MNSGDTYQLFASPEVDEPQAVTVGAALIRRGSNKHTFYRERRNFDFRTRVPLEGLSSALDSAWVSVFSFGLRSRDIHEPQHEP